MYSILPIVLYFRLAAAIRDDDLRSFGGEFALVLLPLNP